MSTRTDSPTHHEPPVLGRHGDFDIYPMPTFLRIEATDVAATTRFYVDGLGMAVMYTGPDIDGVPMITHLRGARYQDVLVVPVDPRHASGSTLTPAFAAPHLDMIADRLKGAHRPERMPWGTRELRVTDPDGNILVLTEPPSEPPTSTIEDAMEATRQRIANSEGQGPPPSS